MAEDKKTFSIEVKASGGPQAAADLKPVETQTKATTAALKELNLETAKLSVETKKLTAEEEHLAAVQARIAARGPIKLASNSTPTGGETYTSGLRPADPLVAKRAYTPPPPEPGPGEAPFGGFALGTAAGLAVSAVSAFVKLSESIHGTEEEMRKLRRSGIEMAQDIASAIVTNPNAAITATKSSLQSLRHEVEEIQNKSTYAKLKNALSEATGHQGDTDRLREFKQQQADAVLQRSVAFDRVVEMGQREQKQMELRADGRTREAEAEKRMNAFIQERLEIEEKFKNADPDQRSAARVAATAAFRAQERTIAQQLASADAEQTVALQQSAAAAALIVRHREKEAAEMERINALGAQLLKIQASQSPNAAQDAAAAIAAFQAQSTAIKEAAANAEKAAGFRGGQAFADRVQGAQDELKIRMLIAAGLQREAEDYQRIVGLKSQIAAITRSGLPAELQIPEIATAAAAAAIETQTVNKQRAESDQQSLQILRDRVDLQKELLAGDSAEAQHAQVKKQLDIDLKNNAKTRTGEAKDTADQLLRQEAAMKNQVIDAKELTAETQRRAAAEAGAKQSFNNKVDQRKNAQDRTPQAIAAQQQAEQKDAQNERRARTGALNEFENSKEHRARSPSERAAARQQFLDQYNQDRFGDTGPEAQSGRRPKKQGPDLAPGQPNFYPRDGGEPAAAPAAEPGQAPAVDAQPVMAALQAAGQAMVAQIAAGISAAPPDIDTSAIESAINEWGSNLQAQIDSITA